MLFITTAIDYTNGKPHIGHVYEKVLADVINRYYKLSGQKTNFLVGTDEHGEKILKAANAKNVTPKEFVDDLSLKCFKKLWEKLSIESDIFVRTTDENHKKFVADILQKVYDKGDIYFAEYEGLYSVGSERFVTEKELVVGSDGIARLPGDKDPPELRKEANYFFRLEKYQSWLYEEINNNSELIQPSGFRNEVLEMLKEPLGDLSISRPKERISWGIEIPWDKNHVTYVWFDALLSYFSSSIAYRKTKKDANKDQTFHIIGKDILKPHAIFWPIMLYSAEFDIFDKLIVHSHILAEDGKKMGKSLGNAIDPWDLVNKYPIDSIRYALLKEAGLASDYPFGENILIEKHNTELANDLGNLLSRTLAMIQKYFDGCIKIPVSYTEEEQRIIALAKSLPNKIMLNIDSLKINKALDVSMSFVRELNKFVADSRPWELAKNKQEDQLTSVLYVLAEGIRIATVCLEPVLPNKCLEIRDQLGLSNKKYSLYDAWGQIESGTKINQGKPVFPKIEKENQEKNMTDNTENKEISIIKEEEKVEFITIDDFTKIDLKLAEVLNCEFVENADRLFKFTLKVGEEERIILSGIRKWFNEPNSLIGKKVVIVANLAPRKMRGIWSQGMILSVEGEDGELDLLTVVKDINSGASVK